MLYYVDMRTIPRAFMLSLLFLFAQEALAVESKHSTIALERVNELIKSNELKDALTILSSYRPSREEISAYHYAYAQALMKSERLYDSVEHLRLAYLYAGPGDEKERILLKRADVYATLGNYSEAVVCLEILINKFPKSNLAEQVQMALAESCYQLGRFREALAHFEKAGASNRKLYGKANALQALGRTTEAHEIYSSLLKKDKEVVNAYPETLLNMGENYRQSGKQADAKMFLNSVKNSPQKEKARLGLGLMAMGEGAFDAAVAYFDEAGRSPERNVRREALLNRADALIRQGKHDDALAALLEIKNKYPYGRTYDTALLMLARLYRLRGQSNEAVGVLKELIYRRTPSSAALDELESVMLEAADKNHDDFVKLWNSSGRWLLDPSRFPFVIKIAKALRYSGKPFFDVCAWLIKYGPEDVKAEGRLLLADFYAGVGDSANAMSYLRRARIKKPDDKVFRIKARLSYADHDYQSAFDMIKAIRQIQDDDVLLLLAAMRPMKDIRKAAEFCKELFQKIPATATAGVRLADILYDAGRKAEALQYYRASLAGRAGTGVSAGKAAQDARDLEWAHYRIAMLSQGEDSLRALKTIEAAKDSAGRFAAAELRGKLLMEKGY